MFWCSDVYVACRCGHRGFTWAFQCTLSCLAYNSSNYIPGQIDIGAIQWNVCDFLLVLHCNYMSTLYSFWHISTHLPKFAEVTWPWILPYTAEFYHGVVVLITINLHSWMISNRLQLNPSKTEVLWYSSARRQHQIPTGPVRAGDTLCSRYEQLDLRVYIDADVSTSAHVTAVVKAWFATLSNMQCVSFDYTNACTCDDKGGLLQLSSLGYYQTTLTMAAVCLQCHRSSHVLRKEVGAHNSIPPQITVAKSSVWAFSSCYTFLPYRHGTIIPCWDPLPDCRSRFTSASSECFYVDAGHTVHTMHHARWSSLPSDCCLSVECSSVICSFCAIAAAVYSVESVSHLIAYIFSQWRLWNHLSCQGKEENPQLRCLTQTWAASEGAWHPCRVCSSNCDYNQDGIQCDGCEAWMHSKCIDMTSGMYAATRTIRSFFVVTV